MRGGKIVTRGLALDGQIMTGEAAQPRYGAYSYILMKKAPRQDRRAWRLIREWHRLPYLTADVASKKQNITLLPVQSVPPSTDPKVPWHLDNYDLDWSLGLLDRLKIKGHGPFIVTAIKPAQRLRLRDNIAIIDFSDVHPDNVDAWFKHFKRCIEEPRSWRANDLTELLLQLHDRFTHIGTSVQPVIIAAEYGRRIIRVVSPATLLRK